MAVVSFTEAARLLGYRTRATLYRCRDDGRLDGYLSGDGLELEPEGLPPLREHLRAVLANRGRDHDRDPGLLLMKQRADTAVQVERASLLRTQRRRIEGELVDAAEMAQLVHRAASIQKERMRQAGGAITRALVTRLRLEGDEAVWVANAVANGIDAGLAAGANCFDALGDPPEVSGGAEGSDVVEFRAKLREWYPGRELSCSDTGSTIIDIKTGENLSGPWPMDVWPLDVARGRAFSWDGGEVGPWRLMSDAEREARHAAWEASR